MNRDHLLQFDLGAPWKREANPGALATWRHPCGDVASFHYFNQPPDFVAAPDAQGIQKIRQMYSDALAGDAGIVSVESVSFSSIPSIEAVFKLPQGQAGLTYIASLTIPLRDFSFIVKFQCPDGKPGLRDGAIDHPLFRARRHLASIGAGVRVDADLMTVPKFGEQHKPRWRFW